MNTYQAHVCTEGQTQKEGVGRRPSESQGERPQREPPVPPLDLELPVSRSVRKSISFLFFFFGMVVVVFELSTFTFSHPISTFL
jgi:hypothetical protein